MNANRKFERQRSAADPTASSWVSASAGTGKTYVLTDRVVRLLLSGVAPARLLCITFTKAAAAEMQDRVFKRLGQWTALDDNTLSDELLQLQGRLPDDHEMARARRLFAQALETPGGLKIQTIHAFCESLLGRFPLEAGLPANFTVMDERTAEELFLAARDRVLDEDNRRDRPIMSALAAYLDERAFQGLMPLLMSERGRLNRLLRRSGGVDGVAALLRDRLGLAADLTEASVMADAGAEAHFDGEGLSWLAELMCAATGKRDRERGQAIADWLAAPARRAETFEDYQRAFIAKSSGEPYKAIVSKGLTDAHPELADIAEREAERVLAVLNARKALRLLEANRLLLALAAAMIARYDLAKRRRAVLDYDDLILHTPRSGQRPDDGALGAL